MDNLHYVLIALLAVAGYLWMAGGDAEVQAPTSDAAMEAFLGWRACMETFSDGLLALDDKHGQDPNYRALYGDRQELLTERITCENAVTAKYNAAN